MFKILFKYAAGVTAAKVGGAASLAEMSAAGLSGLSEAEQSTMGKGSMPEWRAKIDAAAWDGKTYSEAYPDEALYPGLGAKIDAALTPVP